MASYTYGTGADLGKLMTMTEGGSTTNLAYADAAHAHAVTGRSGGAMTAPDTYTYDGDGNIASRYGGEVYAHDAENRLSAVSTYPTRTDYWYDGLGNMNCRWTVTPGTSASGAVNVRDRYIDGIYEERTTSGQAPVVTKNYYAFGRIIAQRKTTASGSTVTYLLADHLGSTVGTLTEGGAAQHVQYYPYGNVRSGSVATDKMFTGQQREGFSRIGAYFYRGRFYATGLGHFLSADSSTADGLDRYAYVRFNPLRYNDPTGHGILIDDDTHCPGNNPNCLESGPGPIGGNGGGGGGGSSQCDADCWAIIAGLLQCAANYDACTGGGSPMPTPTPAPSGPVATPLCGVGAGTCSAPPMGGGGCGGVLWCQVKRPFNTARDSLTECVGGDFNQCLNAVQQADLIPITEACAFAGGVAAGPAGAVAGTGCHAVEMAVELAAASASTVQIVHSDCSRGQKAIATGWLAGNIVVSGIIPLGSEPAEGYMYKQQSDVIASC